MPFGLSEKTLSLLRKLFTQDATIEQVKIYGSRALGNYKEGSDIDLAIYTHSKTNASAHLLAELEALPTPYLFDVTDYYHLDSPSLKKHIDQHGKTLYPTK